MRRSGSRTGTVWNSYLDKKDPTKRHPLPGFVTIDDICLLSTGLPLSNQTTEEKTAFYDFEERKELPKNVHVITSILGLPITLGIVKSTEDKTAGSRFESSRSMNRPAKPVM